MIDRSRCCVYTVLLSCLVLAPCDAHAAQSELLLVEGFESAADISGWSYTGPTGGMVSWDAGFGKPPGSLALDYPAGAAGPEVSKARLCFQQSENGPWTIDADVFIGATAECTLSTWQYLEPDCSGTRFPTPDGVTSVGSAQGVWKHLFISTRSGVVEVEMRGFSIDFNAFGDPFGGPADRCVLDNLRVSGPSVVTIPALNEIGVGVAIVLLLVSGLIVLYRSG